MQRTILVHQLKHTLHQAIAFFVQELPQINSACDMIAFVGVASGAAERAFACDLNRKQGLAARKDAAPCLHYCLCLQLAPLFLKADTNPSQCEWDLEQSGLQSCRENLSRGRNDQQSLVQILLSSVSGEAKAAAPEQSE